MAMGQIVFTISSAVLMVAIASATITKIPGSNCSAQKNSGAASELMVLVLLPITGDSPRTGEACRIGIDVILKEINCRDDILPGYRIKAVYKDEGPQAALTMEAAITFKRDYEDMENNTYPSPVVIGPYYSLGCLRLASHVHYHDMVMLAISCTTPLATGNRISYPNLYRTKSTGELVAYPQVHFIKEIGKWSRIGILTNDGYLFDYTLATFVAQVASEQGLNVTFFEITPDADDDVMSALKETDTRVVLVDTSSPAFAIQFLCQAYKFGLTGWPYAFIIHTTAYFEISSIYHLNVRICNVKDILEQLKYVFWVGWSMSAVKNVSRPFLSVEDFEIKFNKTANGLKPADYTKRFNCADAIVQTVLALDESEKTLSRQNLTLKNYRDRPHQVMLAVNGSLAKTDFMSYRIGRFKYSRRLEVDDDLQEITQEREELEGTQLQLFSIKVANLSALYNYSSYTIQQSNAPKWYTGDGNPPKDGASTFVVTTVTPWSCFIVLAAIAGAITVAQIGVVVKSLHVEIPASQPYHRIKTYARTCFGLGSMVLNVAAVLFLCSATFSEASQSLCIVERVVFVLSFTLVDGYTIFRMISYQASSIRLKRRSSAKKKHRKKKKKAAPARSQKKAKENKHSDMQQNLPKMEPAPVVGADKETEAKIITVQPIEEVLQHANGNILADVHVPIVKFTRQDCIPAPKYSDTHAATIKMYHAENNDQRPTEVQSVAGGMPSKKTSDVHGSAKVHPTSNTVKRKTDETLDLHGDQLRQTMGSRAGHGSLGNPSFSEQMLPLIRLDARKLQRRTLQGLVIWLAISAAYLVIWMSLEAPEVNKESATSQIPISSSTAAYDLLITNTFVCQSNNDVAWMLGLAAFHVLFLGVAVFLSFGLRHDRNFAKAHNDFSAVRLANIKTATLLIAAIVILVLLDSITDKLVVLAVLTLAISVIDFVTIFMCIFAVN